MGLSFRSFLNGIRVIPNTTTQTSRAGEIDFQSSDGKFYGNNGSISSPFVFEASAATLSNKTLLNPIISGTMTSITSGDLVLQASSNQSTLITSNGTGTITLDGTVFKTNSITGAASSDLAISAGTARGLSLNTNSSSLDFKVAGTIVASAISTGLTLPTGNSLLLHGNSTFGVGIVAGSSMTANYTIALPSLAPASGSSLSYDGTNYVWAVGGSLYANTNLSNLSAPTALNQSLLPGTDSTQTLGSGSFRFASSSVAGAATSGSAVITDGTNTVSILPTFTSPAAISVSGVQAATSVGVVTSSSAVSNATATGELTLETGNKTAGTGNSGDINIQTGASTGGIRGRILLNAKSINIASQFSSDPLGGATGDVYYNTTINALKIFGASTWSPIGSGQFSTTSTATIASGGTVTLGTGGFQMIRVQGTTNPTQPANALFGSTPPSDGTIIHLVGQSDTATLLLANHDITNGILLNGPCTLNKGKILAFQYDATLGRYLEISRTN